MSPWVKLDDGMGEHRKVKRALKQSRTAVALHLLGILHCAKYLTDGFVEAEFVRDLADDSRMRDREREVALATLIEVGLWSPVEGGWKIHDYLDHNPSRTDVLAKRQADAQRKARGRSNGSPAGLHADSKRTPRGVHEESARPVPSRPVPSSPKPPEGAAVIPIKPSGKRRRDLDRWREDVAAAAARLFPDADPSTARLCVERAPAFIEAQGGTVTDDAIRDYAATWFPMLTKEAS